MGRHLASFMVVLSLVLGTAIASEVHANSYANNPKPITGNWKGVPKSWTETGFDAILRWDDNTWYIFKGKEYIKYRAAKGMTQGPKPVYKNWPGVPKDFAERITAALQWWDGVYYLFSNDGRYIKYTKHGKANGQTPKSVAGNWERVPEDFKVSAAFNSRRNWVVYLFSEDGRYVRYHKDRKGQPPKPILGNWPNLTTRVDAVEAYSNTTYYMTSGSAYQRYVYPLPSKKAKGCGYPGNKPCQKNVLGAKIPYCKKAHYIVVRGTCTDPTREFTKVVKSLGKVPCGTKGQRGCFPGEKGTLIGCEKDLGYNADLLCTPLTCGKLNQRPCRVTEMIPSCPGLKEDFIQNKCVASLQCGQSEQRPCLIFERIPSCDRGLAEDFVKNKCVPDRAACIALANTMQTLLKAPNPNNPILTPLLATANAMKDEVKSYLRVPISKQEIMNPLEIYYDLHKSELQKVARMLKSVADRVDKFTDLFKPATFCGSKSNLLAKMKAAGVDPRHAKLNNWWSPITSAHAASSADIFVLSLTGKVTKGALSFSPGGMIVYDSKGNNVARLATFGFSPAPDIGKGAIGFKVAVSMFSNVAIRDLTGFGLGPTFSLEPLKSGKAEAVDKTGNLFKWAEVVSASGKASIDLMLEWGPFPKPNAKLSGIGGAIEISGTAGNAKENEPGNGSIKQTIIKAIRKAPLSVSYSTCLMGDC